MTADMVETDNCPDCGRWLPWGGGRRCTGCREAAELEALRDWINDNG